MFFVGVSDDVMSEAYECKHNLTCNFHGTQVFFSWETFLTRLLLVILIRSST